MKGPSRPPASTPDSVHRQKLRREINTHDSRLLWWGTNVSARCIIDGPVLFVAPPPPDAGSAWSTDAGQQEKEKKEERASSWEMGGPTASSAALHHLRCGRGSLGAETERTHPPWLIRRAALGGLWRPTPARASHTTDERICFWTRRVDPPGEGETSCYSRTALDIGWGLPRIDLFCWSGYL